MSAYLSMCLKYIRHMNAHTNPIPNRQPCFCLFHRLLHTISSLYCTTAAAVPKKFPVGKDSKLREVRTAVKSPVDIVLPNAFFVVPKTSAPATRLSPLSNLSALFADDFSSSSRASYY